MCPLLFFFSLLLSIQVLKRPLGIALRDTTEQGGVLECGFLHGTVSLEDVWPPYNIHTTEQGGVLECGFTDPARIKESGDTTPCRMTGVTLHSHVRYKNI